MTESIKQEIINNIFENGDKLITGPILQTVLIDMIDDVNVKDQAILSKTGSWDDAVTQIPNLATKEEVTNLSESIARDLENVDVDLTGYATEAWVQDQGYLTEHQDISGLATKTELTAAENNLQGNITSLSESVARDLANVSVPEGVATEAWVQSQDYASKSYVDNAVSSSSVDLTGYATETWVQNQGYLKEHQDISNLATKGELNSVSGSVQTDITNLSESVASSVVWKKGEGQNSIAQILPAISTVGVYSTPTATGEGAIATGYSEASGSNSHAQGYNTLASAPNSHAEGSSTKAEGSNSHAEGFYAKATGEDSHAEGYKTTASGLASHAEGYYTTAEGDYSHAEGSGSNASGRSSHAEGRNTRASTWYSHAEGWDTTTSGMYSHAEGNYTKADGESSHAEGRETKALGGSSHAEGYSTIASNENEHAQGMYNCTSSNQIFSIGAGEYANGSITRRNAVSVLVVPNSDTQVVTASVFVQNIGGYDGTNPTPGTNDLATVINGLSSGGGSSSGGSSETLWRKGTGTDSIVQIIADGTSFPIASGKRAIATGMSTNASGYCSHAEGQGTKAEGLASYAEGRYTNASGDASHAEGLYTTASNEYEHAQGRYNHNSENQIFSIGTGNSDTDRRNVVSVLEVSNNNSYTGSVFVQNVGGYDGTNPTPGTNDLATVINSLSSGGGSSETLWKKGEGTDSIVQVLTGANEVFTPTATGTGAVAIGSETTASGQASHAEGSNTVASGDYSHAEGSWTQANGYYSHAEGDHTNAFGDYSHAEGYQTEAPNSYECALGMCNHSSEGQIFSVGAGEGDPYNPFDPKPITRRNAISVLAVPNSDTQINTASVFVQNVGGYDGTNPIPGTNDLATVINGMSTGGGIGTSTETWTFTLDDGSTVTKNIVMA